MTALIITLSVFIVLIFSIIAGDLDAEKIKRRLEENDPRILKSNTAITLRGGVPFLCNHAWIYSFEYGIQH